MAFTSDGRRLATYTRAGRTDAASAGSIALRPDVSYQNGRLCVTRLVTLDGQTLGWSADECEALAADPELARLLEPMPGSIHCRPDGGDANPSCPHVLELRLLPIAHEQRDVVATGAELERGIDDEALGAADAEAGAEEGDAEAGRGRHGRGKSLLLSCFIIGMVDTDCTQVDCTEVGAQTVAMDHSCTVGVAVVSPAGTPRPDRESRQGSTVAGLP